MRGRVFIGLVAGAVMLLPVAANASEVYPTRPIHLIVPYPPGGGTDIIGRLLGEKLSASLKQPIVVDNRGGAGGVLGTEVVAKAAPDGYTLLLVPTSHVINPSIYAKLPYDTVKAFAPITMVASAAILMAVNPRVPATTVHGFVDAAKADPKGIANFGSAGVGTVFHLTGQMFDELSGLTLQHVPYRGGGPTVTALLAGEVPLAFETMLSLQLMSARARCEPSQSPARNAAPPCLKFQQPLRPAFRSWLPTIRMLYLPRQERRCRFWCSCTTPQWRRSHCRTYGTGCASKVPRWLATVQPNWPPMSPLKFRNGQRWRAKPA
jgi:tripartite-type tricarboxylate transporter receptor subunit TctC